MPTDKQNNREKGWIGIAVLVLCVLLSGAVVFGMIGRSVSDEDAIDLVPTEAKRVSTEEVNAVNTSQAVVKDASAEADAADSQLTTTEQPEETESAQQETTAQAPTVVVDPGMEVRDEQQVWTTATKVDIFKVSYANGESQITVNSDDGDKLLAPGTENNYSFQLKNTGNCVLDYTMTMEAYFSAEDKRIPVDVRMKNYNGTWLVGGEDYWEDVLTLNQVEDNASLGINRYADYTLQWMWPFESGDDVADTALGNGALNEDITLTIVIKTTATADPSTVLGPGIPQTGDDFPLWFFASTAAVSIVMVFLLLMYKRYRRKEEADGTDGL